MPNPPTLAGQRQRPHPGLPRQDANRPSMPWARNHLTSPYSKPYPAVAQSCRRLASLQLALSWSPLDVSLLPLSPAALAVCEERTVQTTALGGGDDYELCFTIPEEFEGKLKALNGKQTTPIVKVGEVCAEKGIRLIGSGSEYLDPETIGHRHSWPAES